MASKPELSDDGVMVFRPSMKEFRDFEAYVTYMESCGAHKYGIAKVRNTFAVSMELRRLGDS